MAEVNMPSGFGGLMRYKEEYNSKLKFSPATVILMIILVVAFAIALRVFFPIKAAATAATAFLALL